MSLDRDDRRESKARPEQLTADEGDETHEHVEILTDPLPGSWRKRRSVDRAGQRADLLVTPFTVPG